MSNTLNARLRVLVLRDPGFQLDGQDTESGDFRLKLWRLSQRQFNLGATFERQLIQYVSGQFGRISGEFHESFRMRIKTGQEPWRDGGVGSNSANLRRNDFSAVCRRNPTLVTERLVTWAISW